jgi:hypothetical protein
MRRPRPSSLSEAIAALLRRLLRSGAAARPGVARRASRGNLTVVGRFPAAGRVRAANDPDAP